MDQDTEEPANQKGDLEHLEVLYNLWKGAGKQVNLWDWLQGYKNHITGQGEDENEDEVDNDGDTERQEDGEGKKRKRKLADVDEDGIHASFVRKRGCWVWFERGVKAWEGKLMRLLKVLLCSSIISIIRGSGARKCISACLFYLKLVTHHYRIISHHHIHITHSCLDLVWRTIKKRK
jgi:hypothetical protein